MRIIPLIFCFFLVALLMIGSTLKESDMALNETRDIINFTETKINFSVSRELFLNKTVNPYPESEEQLINVQRFRKSIDYLLYSTLGIVEELSKMTIEFGYRKPLDYETIFNLLKYIIIVVLIVVLIKPVGYVIIFIIMSAMYINEKIKSRKEKRRFSKWKKKI